MKITLCGSTRFKAEYIEANMRLTLAGHVVYTVASMMHADGDNITPIQKENLDLVHLAKILNSDAIVVVGVGPDDKPYIGDSTRREIVWARMNCKDIFFGMEHFLGNEYLELTKLDLLLP